MSLFSSVQSLSRVPFFATSWIAARQASLSITNSRSSLRLMSIESVMPSSHLILCCPSFSSCPQSLPASETFPVSQFFAWGGQSIGVSALASVLPKKSQGWSPSEWTGWISLQSSISSIVLSFLEYYIVDNIQPCHAGFFHVYIHTHTHTHTHTYIHLIFLHFFFVA